MTVKCLGCANGVITQWIMLENVLVVRTYMLKYSGMKCYCFQIVQKKKKKKPDRDKQMWQSVNDW